MLFSRTLLLCAATATLVAQDVARPSFEVASVKPSAAAPGEAAIKQDRLMDMAMAQANGSAIRMMDKGRVSLKRQTLAMLIAGAYATPADQVEGPAWIRELRFDVDAKVPEGAPAAAVPQMMQTLLAERFSLRLHQEDREAPGYALVVAKGGPKLDPAAPKTDAPAAPPDMDAMKARLQEQMTKMRSEQKGQMMSDGVTGGGFSSRWTNPHLSMAGTAARLTATLHQPVSDATGLTGEYNVTLFVQQAADEDIASATERGLSPLGLKLDPRKVPVKIVVVESANKTPTEN